MSGIKIVGAGVSGALVAYFLRNSFKVASSIPITIYDKSRGVGGRLSTSRLNCPETGETIAKVDLGAQHYSFNCRESDLSKQQRGILELWEEHNLVKEISEGQIVDAPEKYRTVKNYMASNGNSSLVKILLEKAGNVEKVFNKKISKGDLDDQEWVFTVPVPQMLEILDLENGLDKVNYSVRYCLGLAVEKLPENLDSKANYISNSKIRYIGNNHLQESLKLQSLCIHSSVPFALSNIDKTKEEGGEILLSELNKLYPELEIKSVKHHRWLYSQVYKSPFAGTSYFNKNNVTLTGDAFAETHNVLGCIDAAYNTAKFIATKLLSK